MGAIYQAALVATTNCLNYWPGMDRAIGAVDLIASGTAPDSASGRGFTTNGTSSYAYIPASTFPAGSFTLVFTASSLSAVAPAGAAVCGGCRAAGLNSGSATNICAVGLATNEFWNFDANRAVGILGSTVANAKTSLNTHYILIYPGTPVQFALVYNSGTGAVTLYVNGSIFTPTSPTGVVAPTSYPDFAFGACLENGTAAKFHAFRFSDISLHSAALSTDDLKTLLLAREQERVGSSGFSLATAITAKPH